MIISQATVIQRKLNTPVISIHRYLVNKGYKVFLFFFCVVLFFVLFFILSKFPNSHSLV